LSYYPSIVVLMYHHILPRAGFITISMDIFQQQMELIKKLNYKTLSLEEFKLFKEGKLKIKKGVVITFDDGWRDNYYYAYPVLKKLELKGTIFLPTEWIEEATQKYINNKVRFNPLPHSEAKKQVVKDPASIILNWKEIDKMRDVFCFASHSHSHRDFYFGKKYSWEEEFYLSKEILNKKGCNIDSFCWPRGKYTSNILNIGKQFYKYFWTTERGINIPNGKVDKIKRIAVKNSVSWLKKQLLIFSNPILGTLYNKIKG